MKRRRVKVTGIGPVTPAGIGREEFWRGIRNSESFVGPAKSLAAFGSVAAEVKGFKVSNYLDSGGRNLSRMTQFAIGAASLAIADAGVSLEEIRAKNVCLLVGSALMDPQVIMTSILDVATKGVRFAKPRLVRDAIGSASSGAVINSLDLKARTISYQTACCSGLDAIGFASELVSRGEADFVLAGGTEAPIFQHPMLEIQAAGLAPQTTDNAARLGRPFDLWRTTGVIGEGACFVVLEPEESPREGYAFIDGFGYANDTSLGSCSGLRDAIKAALGNAGLFPEQVEFINAWGPGHKEVDAAEVKILKQVFGARLAEVPAASIKGAIGNPFGAAGAIQVASTLLGFRDGVIVPTVNWKRRDPDCDLNLSSRERYCHFDNAIINAHGVSGTNSCLVLSRCR